jgi:hypothetical protein
MNYSCWTEVFQLWRGDLISWTNAPRSLSRRSVQVAVGIQPVSTLEPRQFEPEVILLAVGWYLRFSLSYRNVEELLAAPVKLGSPEYEKDGLPMKEKSV